MNWHYSQITNRWMASGDNDRLWKVEYDSTQDMWLLSEGFAGTTTAFHTATGAMAEANQLELNLKEAIHA